MLDEILEKRLRSHAMKNRSHILVSPVSRTSAWTKSWVQIKWNWRGMPTIYGREFWAWFLRGGGGGGLKRWNPGGIRPKNSQEEFAIKIRWDIRRPFSLNSPDQITKSALQSLGINTSCKTAAWKTGFLGISSKQLTLQYRYVALFGRSAFWTCSI